MTLCVCVCINMGVYVTLRATNYKHSENVWHVADVA